MTQAEPASIPHPLRIKRRSFLASMGALTLPWAVAPARATGNNRPNLLFVLCDQWRFCTFSHGEVHDTLVQTPNLDHFITEGVRWRKAYSTYPLCTPERAILMTGRYGHQTGMMENDKMLPPGNRCLAEIFSEAGYITHYIGKTHFDGAAKPGFVPHGWRRRGFHSYEGFNRGHIYLPRPSNMEMFSDDGVPMAESAGRYEPEFQADLAMDFIDRNKNRPWFCYLSWGPPHTPYSDVPSKYKTYDLGPTPSDHYRPNVSGNPSGLADYYAQCTALDDNFGRLMQHIEDLGLTDNTLVVFTSDHGDMHLSQGYADNKRIFFEESAHVPLFMRKPGMIPAGITTDTLIGGVDIMPTLLGLCGLPVPKSCAGVNKSPAATGTDLTGSVNSIYIEGYPHSDIYTHYRCVVDNQYKLAVDNKSNPMTIANVTNLYDLENDPYELTNLVDDPAYATIKQQLYNKLVQWIADTDDTFPVNPPMALNMYTT